MVRLTDRVRYQQGAALVESCLVIMMICLVMTSVLQVARIQVAHDLLGHAAASAARAKTVGFNQWMIAKVTRAAAIPNGGKLLEPDLDYTDGSLETALATLRAGSLWNWSLSTTPSAMQLTVERARIPSYLEAVNNMDASMVLDYEDWPSIDMQTDAGGLGGSAGFNPMIHAVVTQEYPLQIPLHHAFYNGDTIALEGEATLENHYTLYLDDQGM